jgi:serine/threonine protein kinase
MADILRFRRANGDYEEFRMTPVEDADQRAGEFLMTRTIRLEDGTPGGRELRQHRPISGDHRNDGYARLDNEILTGRRLYRMASGGDYPRVLACLYGDEPDSADPCALFEPYRGEPLSESGAYLSDDFETFLVGLLTGLCWLAGAGIAHRAISPETVWWDYSSKQVQITDFSRSALFGTARTPLTGDSEWIARESRAGTYYGAVGSSDDIWAAVRLMYFVRSQGEKLDDPAKLKASDLSPMFNGLLEYVLQPPEVRPTANDLVIHGLRRPHLVPSLADGKQALVSGRENFLHGPRYQKHPSQEIPVEFWDDIADSWKRSLWEAGGPGGSGG